MEFCNYLYFHCWFREGSRWQSISSIKHRFWIYLQENTDTTHRGECMRRIFVGTVVRFDSEGAITPLQILWTDGAKYEIDKILKTEATPALRSNTGFRYLVRIQGQELELGYDGRRWFIMAYDWKTRRRCLSPAPGFAYRVRMNTLSTHNYFMGKKKFIFQISIKINSCHVFHVPAVYLSCTRGKKKARKSLIHKDFRESGNYSHSPS